IYDPSISTGLAGAGNGTDVANALANAYLNWNNDESFSSNGNLWATYDIMEGLSYKFNLGIDLYMNRTQNYTSAYSVGQYQNFDPDRLNISNGRNNHVLYEHTLSYHTYIGKHSISAFAGLTAENSRYYCLNARARDLPSPDLLILAL